MDSTSLTCTNDGSAVFPPRDRELGQQFIDWLVSPDGQKAIANYKINGTSRDRAIDAVSPPDSLASVADLN
jgi:hypothetical protein